MGILGLGADVAGLALPVPSRGKLKLIAILGTALLFALVLGWGLRVDALRALYKGQIDGITTTIDKVTDYKKPVKGALASVAVMEIAGDRDQYHRERDNSRATVKLQSTSIYAYEEQTKRLRAISAANEVTAKRLIADRDAWMHKAKIAATRTQRLTAEAELKQCEEVLDALYQADL